MISPLERDKVKAIVSRLCEATINKALRFFITDVSDGNRL